MTRPSKTEIERLLKDLEERFRTQGEESPPPSEQQRDHLETVFDPDHARDVLPAEEADRLDAAERALAEDGATDADGELTEAAREVLDIYFGAVSEAELDT